MCEAINIIIEKKLFFGLNKISIIRTNARKLNKFVIYFFLKFAIDVRGGHCYYSPRASKKPCYVTVRSSVGLLGSAVTLKVFAWRLCCFTFS